MHWLLAAPSGHPSDHVGVAPEAYDPPALAIHRAAIEQMTKAERAGQPITYAAALIAVTHK